jgi:hypothetical protein
MDQEERRDAQSGWQQRQCTEKVGSRIAYPCVVRAGSASHSRRPGDVCVATPRTVTTTDERVASMGGASHTNRESGLIRSPVKDTGQNKGHSRVLLTDHVKTTSVMRFIYPHLCALAGPKF